MMCTSYLVKTGKNVIVFSFPQGQLVQYICKEGSTTDAVVQLPLYELVFIVTVHLH